MIKNKIDIIHRITNDDWNEGVRTTYGRINYDVMCAEGLSSDSLKEFTAEQRAIDSYEQQQLSDFEGGDSDGDFMLYMLAADLCNRGELEPGNYLLELCY